MKIGLSLFIILVINTIPYSLVTQKDDHKLDSIYDEIQLLTGDNWYLEKTNEGFKMTYCRSCGEAYKLYIDYFNFESEILAREFFFQPSKIDSICYYSTVSNLLVPRNMNENEKIIYFTELFKPNDILWFNVKFEEKWSIDKYDSILAMNELLKEAILKEPLYKSNMNIFSDYRYWIPDTYFKRRTESYDFYFQRLPYSSLILDYSIFIEPNKPFFFSEPLLVDKSDPKFYRKDVNFLEDERVRTLKIIALVLGIHDFSVIN